MWMQTREFLDLAPQDLAAWQNQLQLAQQAVGHLRHCQQQQLGASQPAVIPAVAEKSAKTSDGRMRRLTWNHKELAGYDCFVQLVKMARALGITWSGYGKKQIGCQAIAEALCDQTGFAFPGYALLSAESVDTHYTSCLAWGKLRATVSHPLKPTYNTVPPSPAYGDSGVCELDILVVDMYQRDKEFNNQQKKKKEDKAEENAHKDGASRVLLQVVGQVEGDDEEPNGEDGEEEEEEDADDGSRCIYMGGGPETPNPKPPSFIFQF